MAIFDHLSDLGTRTASAIVMAIIAIGATWLGSWYFFAFAVVVALVAFSEWIKILGHGLFSLPALLGYASILASSHMMMTDGTPFLLVPLGCAIAVLILAGSVLKNSLLLVTGLAICGLFGLSLISLRADPELGFLAIVVLFALVWGTDIGAYFTGRLIGGPKLWPVVSPKKTWSGSVGGTLIGAVSAAMIIYYQAGLISALFIGLLIVLSILSQLGDLGESGLKRKFGVKDSGSIIPGHGGVLDRIDGFAIACIAAAAIGVGWPDLGTSAAGFLGW